jgi:acetyl esterase/lipase
VVESGAAVFVNYTRSPEAHYPVAINQAYNATKWVAEYGNEIGVDGKRLAVAETVLEDGYRCCNDG